MHFVSFQFIVLSVPSFAILHHSHRHLCLSLLQVPSPLVCGSFRSIVSLGGRVAHWDVSLLCTFMFFSCCSSAFGLLFTPLHYQLCVRDLLLSFLFFLGFLRSFVLVGVVPFLFSVFCLPFGIPVLSGAFRPCYPLPFFLFFHEVLRCFPP